MARSPSRRKSRRTKTRGKTRRVPVWAATLVVLLVAATLVILYFTRMETGLLPFDVFSTEEPQPDPAMRLLRVEQGVREALADLGVAGEQLSIEGVEADGTRSGPALWEAPLPPGVLLEEANTAVTLAVRNASGRVVDAVESKAGGQYPRRLTMVVAADSVPSLELNLYEVARSKESRGRPTARLAIVVGGLGPELNGPTSDIIECPLPLTLAVLPEQKASKEIARLAHAGGKEVLLHLPMEPKGYPRADPGKGAVLVHHSEREIRGLLRSHIEGLAHVSGVVNYMGSAGTRDRDVMRAALKETKKRGLFFLDGTTSVDSVVRETAAELGVPCLINDLFLEEGRHGKGLLKRRLGRAEELALQRGKAVVIAEPSASLLELLNERAAEYSSRGIVLAKASELLEDS